MPNKRSRRKKTEKYLCPFCEQRLWRTGTTKHYIFYKSAAEIKQNTGISSKKSAFLAQKNSTYLDTKKWIESFCCQNHGALWLVITVRQDVREYRIALEKDWLQTNKTFDPRKPNPSVSEFTMKMSRKPVYK